MKVKIENMGGPAYNTRIIDAETGKMIENAFSVTWTATSNRHDEVPTATISVYMPVVSVWADATIKQVCPCCGQSVPSSEPPTARVDPLLIEEGDA